MATATAKIMNQFERRPTYNELVEMIEEEELKVKPSIENVIDRKASIFRNNQYGGRFDNPDLVGLQKQEQMRQLKMMKEATMREAMFNDPDRARFGQPPPQAGFQSPIPQPPLPEVSDDFQRFRMELLLGRVQDRLQQVRQGNREMADEMLSAVSQEESPQGVEQFMMATPPQTFESPLLSPATATGEQLPPLQPMDEQLPNTVEDESVRRNVAQNFLQDIFSRTQPQQQQPASSSQQPPPLPAMEDSRILDKIKELHPDMVSNEQLQAYRILNEVKNKTSRAYANNITLMSRTVDGLANLGMISQDDIDEYGELKKMLMEAKGKEKKDEIREEIGNWYNRNVYLKYIASERVVKGARSKALSRATQFGKKLAGDALVEGGARLADSQLQGSGDVVRGVANLFKG